MRRRARTTLRPATLASLLLVGLQLTAASASEHADPCAFESVEGYVNALLGETQDEIDRAGVSLGGEAAGEQAMEGATEALQRPNGEGAGSGGLDTYRKLFVAFNLGSVSEADKALVFDFSPDLFELGGLGGLSLRAVVREGEIFASLDDGLDALPDGAGAERRSDLEESIGDFDDVEYQLRWASSDQSAVRPAEQALNAMFGVSYSALQESFRRSAEAFVAQKAALDRRMRATGAESFQAFCATQPETGGPLAEIRSTAETVQQQAARLQSDLQALGSGDIADLIEGEPTWALDIAYRDKTAVTGPSTTTARLQFEMGERSFASWKRWSKRQDRALDVPSFAEYVRKVRPATGGRASIRFLAEYSESEPYRFALPEDDLVVERPGARVFAAALAVGRRVSEKQRTRFDLEAKYEDASGDPERNDRLVSTLSWTQKLSDQLATLAGGSNLVVALVYASRPEYRGEVDDELSLRAGLKWSIDGASTLSTGEQE